MKKVVKSKRKKGKYPNGKSHPAPTRQAVEAAKASSTSNEWWKRRAKHGRDVLFSSPQLLWEAACEYFKYVDNNPWYRSENKIVSQGMNLGSSVELHEEPVKTPYSIGGLTIYLGCGTAYFRQFKESKTYKENENFSTIISMIEDVIRTQQWDGASAGFFNANIISRTLGLAEKTDITNNGESFGTPIIQNFNCAPPLAGDETEIDNKK